MRTEGRRPTRDQSVVEPLAEKGNHLENSDAAMTQSPVDKPHRRCASPRHFQWKGNERNLGLMCRFPVLIHRSYRTVSYSAHPFLPVSTCSEASGALSNNAFRNLLPSRCLVRLNDALCHHGQRSPAPSQGGAICKNQVRLSFAHLTFVPFC